VHEHRCEHRSERRQHDLAQRKRRRSRSGIAFARRAGTPYIRPLFGYSGHFLAQPWHRHVRTDAAKAAEGLDMTYLLEEAITQVTDDELLIPGGLGTAAPSLRDRLARAEEARADERSKRLTAEATATHLAELIAQEHEHVVEQREARERAEAALARAERTAKEMAELVQRQSERADEAEEASRRAFTAYLDDPFRAPEPPPSRRGRLLAKLR
jgi:hypothetical protein